MCDGDMAQFSYMALALGDPRVLFAMERIFYFNLCGFSRFTLVVPIASISGLFLALASDE
jgi:hypothetical protein